MVKTVLSMEGLVCDMCDAHMNDAIRQAFQVKKVTTSHSKGETVIISENEISRGDLEKAVSETGYRILSVKTEPYEKKGLFGF
ncbi:MAG: copper resistance protein CopZ [Clostridiales bacterium]|nr:copper resistance protein CopZ [Clostridiales bacterium]